MSNSQIPLTLRVQLEILVDFNSWSGGGLPIEGDHDEYAEYNLEDHYTDAYAVWLEDMQADTIKTLLPVYEAFTEEFETSLGYLDTTKTLRKLSVKPELGRAEITIKIQNRLMSDTTPPKGFLPLPDAQKMLEDHMGDLSNMVLKPKGTYAEHQHFQQDGVVYDQFSFCLSFPLDKMNEISKKNTKEINISFHN